MSIPASYSDRPLWTILIVDAALTPVGIFASAWLLRINEPMQAIRTGVLATGIVVGVGVVIVGVGSMIVDSLGGGKNHPAAEQITPASPVTYTPPPAAIVTRRTAKDWRQPTPLPTPSGPDQYVAVPEADGDSENPATVEEEVLTR